MVQIIQLNLIWNKFSHGKFILNPPFLTNYVWPKIARFLQTPKNVIGNIFKQD